MRNMIYKILLLFVFTFGVTQDNKNIIFSNNQNIEEYKKMLDQSFNYVEEYYVDSINQSEIIKSAIKGMLKPLDPYTKVNSW